MNIIINVKLKICFEQKKGVLIVEKIKNYYPGGNTVKGFHSFYDSNLKGLDRVFILKGGPGTGKSSLMKKIGNEWVEKGYNIEFLHCSSDNNSIDGVIIPSLKVGIVDGTAPHVIEPKAPGAVEEYVNLGEAWDTNKLITNKNEIQNLTSRISENFQKAYSIFNDALEIHDNWETIYISTMDYTKADQLTNTLIESFFGKTAFDKEADVRHRFFGAATPQGPVDFIPNLTEDITKRYFIKGRPGTGKSTMLKKLAEAAAAKGIDVEVYHCGFDPNSLDMVIFRELDLCIFDSTAPHEYYPSRDGDEIIDVYDLLITPGTDERFAEKLTNIEAQYKSKMAEATGYLAKAKELHDELEVFYISAMDFSKVKIIQGKIENEIENIASHF
jgi:Cdc6-like AAA superfamily ATPase